VDTPIPNQAYTIHTVRHTYPVRPHLYTQLLEAILGVGRQPRLYLLHENQWGGDVKLGGESRIENLKKLRTTKRWRPDKHLLVSPPPNIPVHEPF